MKEWSNRQIGLWLVMASCAVLIRGVMSDQADADALNALRTHVTGLNWSHPANATVCPSDFVGVTCIGNRVTGIDRRFSNIVGEIPPEIGLLSELLLLDLMGNVGISGEIPLEIGNLVQLRTLYLSMTSLRRLPDTIGQMKSLRSFWAYDAPLGGTIPPSISGLPFLQFLDLTNCSLFGPIPDLAGTSLRILYLRNNKLTGTIPQTLGNLVARGLHNMDLALNYLTGTIPTTILQNTTNLTLDLSCNGFGVCSSAPSIQFLDICITQQSPNVTVNAACRQMWEAVSCEMTGFICPALPNPPEVCSSAPPDPAALFDCIGGEWVSKEPTIKVPVLEVTGPTVVTGNLSVTGTVIFQGLHGSIDVDGCVVDLGSIEIQLTKEDIDELAKSETSRLRQFLKHNCSQDIPAVAIKLTNPKGCRRTTTSINTDEKQVLNVFFNINSNKCRLWWIVLASVLGGLVLLVILFVIIVLNNSRLQKTLLPISWAKKHQAAKEVRPVTQ